MTQKKIAANPTKAANSSKTASSSKQEPKSLGLLQSILETTTAEFRAAQDNMKKAKIRLSTAQTQQVAAQEGLIREIEVVTSMNRVNPIGTN